MFVSLAGPLNAELQQCDASSKGCNIALCGQLDVIAGTGIPHTAEAGSQSDTCKATLSGCQGTPLTGTLQTRPSNVGFAGLAGNNLQKSPKACSLPRISATPS